MGLTLLCTGCAQWASWVQPEDAERSKPEPKVALSPWHYESLVLCRVENDALDSFQLPQQVDLWDRLREGFAFPELHNSRVQQQIDWYTRHPSYLPRVTERGSRYLYHILGELERRQLPMELALLPIVESAFDPFAYSHGRASGLWQIIPGTGTMLGLKQNWWYDGRRDVLASTDAALNYLERLNERFDGDWMLALAAYNAGGGTVNRAIRRNKARGRDTDFWSLDLPRETQAYVPRLLALKALVREPEQHSIALHPIPNEALFEPVDVGSQIDLAQAAELAGLSMEEFYSLNPAFNRWATDPEGPHQLLIPIDHVAAFTETLAELSLGERVSWDRYTIRQGDTLSQIAKRYNTTVASLQTINKISGHRIRAGQTLMVPVAAETAGHYVHSAAQRLQTQQNRGSGNRVEHTVRSGDSLWTIGRRYGVTPRQLASWNNRAPGDPIFPGQTLVVWTEETTQVAANSSTPIVRRVHYTVRRGDSLARIAQRFNVRVTDILSWNDVNPNRYLQPGDALTLHVDVTGSR